MATWRLGVFVALFALAFVGAATTRRCSDGESMAANELVLAYASQWEAHECSTDCSDACTTVQVGLASSLPDCLTSGSNYRAYYASLLAACTTQGGGSASHSHSGSGSENDVGATVATPAPTKRSGASAMGFAGMCGFFAVLAFGHIY